MRAIQPQGLVAPMSPLIDQRKVLVTVKLERIEVALIDKCDDFIGYRLAEGQLAAFPLALDATSMLFDRLNLYLRKHQLALFSRSQNHALKNALLSSKVEPCLLLSHQFGDLPQRDAH